MSCVQDQKVFHEQRHGPAVEKDVMVGHEKPESVAGQSHQGVPHQRRCGELEFVGLIRRGDSGEFGLAFNLVLDTAEIYRIPLDRSPIHHNLDRSACIIGDERDPKTLVSVHDGLRRAAKTICVDGAGQIECHLHGVDVDRFFGQHRVEEHSVLQRRQRPDVGHVREILFDLRDRTLVEIDQWQIGRGKPTCTRSVHVYRESSKSRHPQLRQS